MSAGHKPGGLRQRRIACGSRGKEGQFQYHAVDVPDEIHFILLIKQAEEKKNASPNSIHLPGLVAANEQLPRPNVIFNQNKLLKQSGQSGKNISFSIYSFVILVFPDPLVFILRAGIRFAFILCTPGTEGFRVSEPDDRV